jgi:hypothetical protein
MAIAVVAAVVIGLSAPPPPIAPCQPGQVCSPPATLVPVASSSHLPIPTLRVGSPGPSGQPPATPGSSAAPGPSVAPTASPSSDSPPALAGTLFRDDALGWSFEYNERDFTVSDTRPGLVILDGVDLDTQVWVEVKSADDASPSDLMALELSDVDRMMIGRVVDRDGYDALLGPSIGYVSGDGGVWSGTIVSRDGSPVAPGGATAIVATDGRLTAAVVVVVGNPDARFGDDTQQHFARAAADLILKTFKWTAQ